ncbi:MAG: glycine--tRNA ligase subunit beta [Betaproteobacteria bacterium]|nr:glycine--tRNA ligase subunit beta [Betaproteobacteria bacterium]
MIAQNLIVEILVEELPPKALESLGESFASSLVASLKRDGLAPENAIVTAYATPRRLAAHITEVSAAAADKAVSQKLMPVSVGFKEGAPTPALLKKLAALGADASAVEKLRRENDGKADILFFDSTVKGATLAEGLQKAIEAALAALPIPKVMSYQLADGWTTVNFVRPAHGLLAVHGAVNVPVSVLGLHSGKTTYGHRFEGGSDPISVEHADYYARTLLDRGAVIASFAERRDEIARQLTAAAAKAGPDLRPVEDAALLDEVTALVERPNVLVGQFDEEFLEVPQECLILTMKANQKYFPLLDAAGKLTHHFLIVSNLTPADPSAIIGGNERVVRPRLADARFFFNQDRKKTLESRLPALDKVVYHNKLGSQLARCERVTSIARDIVIKLPENLTPTESIILDKRVKQAASIAKADLLTDMVGEFPELQGIMGRYYALGDGYNEEVADAVEDHYKPRFAGDTLPRGRTGMIVALADKLETLTGMFSIGQVPTGDKDPFALRRHALGVIRILSEGGINVPLCELLGLAAARFVTKASKKGKKAAQEKQEKNTNTEKLKEFIFDRLAVNLREQGYTAREVDAVLCLAPPLLSDIPKRLKAVRDFVALPQADVLAAANKRVANILKKATDSTDAKLDHALLQEPAEVALSEALERLVPLADAEFMQGDYSRSLQTLAALRDLVDEFFDKVLVNAENPALRANRLVLLDRLYGAMNKVADLSRLST